MCCCGEYCAAPVVYNLRSQTRVYNARNIRQLAQFYRSSAGCLCCCMSYECGIEVSFNEFNVDQSKHGVFNIESRNTYAFISVLRSLLGTTIGKVEAWMDLSANDHLLYVVSGTNDLVHNGDVHSASTTLCELQQQILEVLPVIDDVLVANPSLKQDDYSFSDELTQVNVVADSGKVTIPRKWVPLMRNEQILAVTGQMYRLGLKDWIMCVLTAGLYYCFVLHRKKYERAALILTNKRVIELALYQRTGTVPANLHNCFVRVTSFIPGSITGGYMISSGGKTNR
jgi:hypothetical protein